MATVSSARVQQSATRNSRVGYLSEGRIAHQTWLASGITPDFTRAWT